MGNNVKQNVMRCGRCNRPTLHYKNTRQMSWLMHFVLAFFTGGAWLIFWFFTAMYHTIAKPVTALANRWTCSTCGNKQ